MTHKGELNLHLNTWNKSLIKLCLLTKVEQPWMAQMGSQEVGY